MRNQLAVGERVYLRLFEEGDAGVLSRSLSEETEVEHDEDGRVPTCTLAFEHWIREFASDPVPQELMFAICRISDDSCIGTVSLRHIDLVNGTAETGTGLFSADYRGKGIGTEAKHVLLRYGFEVLGLHAVSSRVFSENTRSAAALRKQGYSLAGRLTADVHCRGHYMDTLKFDMLRHEWEAAAGIIPEEKQTRPQDRPA